jgi:hypothetical protein
MNTPVTIRTGRAGRGGGGAGLRACGREDPVDLPVARDVVGAPERARGVDVRVAMVLKLVAATDDTSPPGRVSVAAFTTAAARTARPLAAGDLPLSVRRATVESCP